MLTHGIAQKIRTLIIDKHQLVRAGFQALFAHSHDIEVVGTAGNGAEALQCIDALHPDVVILEARPLDMSGIDLVRQLRATWPEIALLMLVGEDAGMFCQSFRQVGVQGCLQKTATYEDLAAAVRVVARGWMVQCTHLSHAACRDTTEQLTEREIEVLHHIAAGRRNHEIAASLVVSTRTVEFHISHILDKLAAHSRTDALQKAIRQGIIPALIDNIETFKR